MNEKEKSNLKMLSTLHYAYAAFLLLSTVGVLIAFFVMFRAMEASEGAGAFSSQIGLFFHVVAVTAVVQSLVMVLLHTLTGVFIAKRKHWLLCVATAGLACMYVPVGTLLGGFSLYVLLKDSVKGEFSGDAERKTSATDWSAPASDSV